MTKIPRLAVGALALSMVGAVGGAHQAKQRGAWGGPASDSEKQRRRDVKAGRAPVLIAKADAKRQRKAARRAQTQRGQ